MKPENKGTLTTVLTYHVVPISLNAAALERQIRCGKGKAQIKTVQGSR